MSELKAREEIGWLRDKCLAKKPGGFMEVLRIVEKATAVVAFSQGKPAAFLGAEVFDGLAPESDRVIAEFWMEGALVEEPGFLPTYGCDIVQRERDETDSKSKHVPRATESSWGAIG